MAFITGTLWAGFTEANAKAGSFIELVYRALGCMVLLIGMFKIFIGLYRYRRAEAWSWWAALTIGVIEWGFMFPYTAIVGGMSTLVFSIVGVVLFLVAIVLPARSILSKKT